MNLAAIDLGFMYTKSIINGQLIKVKSVVGESRSLVFSHLSDTTKNAIEIKIGDKRFFVSDLAIQQSESIYYSLRPDRFDNMIIKALLYTALAQGYPNKELIIKVVSGLPVSHFQLYKENLKQLIMGEHRIELKMGSEIIKSIVSITQSRLLPQPFGTLLNKVLSNKGDIEDKGLVNRTVAVIDIGFGTTDILVSESLTPIEKLTFSTPTAINHTCRLISSKILEKFGVMLPIYKLSDIITSKKFIQKGMSHDITSIIDWASASTSEQLLGEIQIKWLNDWEIGHVLFTGGGSILLYQYLSPYFPSSELVVDSQWANVNGYTKWGMRTWGKEND